MVKVIIVQQINCTNSGHFHCPENVPENDRRSVFRTNSGLGQTPDDFRTNYNVRKRSFSGTLSRQWKCPEFVQLVFLDKFRTNSGHSFFIGYCNRILSTRMINFRLDFFVIYLSISLSS